MSDKSHIEEETLIVKNLSGEASTAEKQALQDWIALSKENEQTYLGFKKTFELAGQHQSFQDSIIDINIDQEWNQFIDKVDHKTKGKAVQVDFTPQRIWLRIAAAVLLVIASGVVINYFIGQSDQVYQTAENTETITLPDGSTVFLNRNSRISFSNNFGRENRYISLSGEGFFDVKPDKTNPFVIEVANAKVTVVGTSFNVKGYEDKEQLEVTVETGIVKLEPNEINQSIELKAGEVGIFDKKRKDLALKTNENDNYLAWKTKRIVFDGTSLREVVQIINDTYGVEMMLSTEVSDACQVTVIFDNQSLDAVLNILKSTLNLIYKIEGNKIEITKAEC